MKKIITILITVCASQLAGAQTVNYVRNPGFEQYVKCPDDWSKIFYAIPWCNASDSTLSLGAEFFHECSNATLDKGIHIPDNTNFWQYTHSGKGMAGGHFYNDKSVWLEKGDLPYDYRDNLQCRLSSSLISGKTYCVSFWLNSVEATGYVHNKIGAYLDNGAINSIADTPGLAITTVTPQVYTDDIIEDTMRWIKVEGTFIATGNETHITIGNFFPDAALSKKYPNYWGVLYTTSYYLIDDVSVVPLDWKPNAGTDTWVELGKQVSIGDTTAEGIDSKWYYKGMLIDSGGVISVNAAATAGKIDTYVVVQTVCGITKRDTVNVRTMPVGIPHTEGARAELSVYPNPSNGTFTITTVILNTAQRSEGSLTVYDLLGRKLYTEILNIKNSTTTVQLKAPDGLYILELTNEQGESLRERIEIRN